MPRELNTKRLPLPSKQKNQNPSIKREGVRRSGSENLGNQLEKKKTNVIKSDKTYWETKKKESEEWPLIRDGKNIKIFLENALQNNIEYQ